MHKVRLFVVATMALLLSACAGVLPNEYVLSPQQLNSQFDRLFPLNSTLANGLFRTSMSTPQLGFVPGQGRLTLDSGISVSTMFGKGLSGRMRLSSGIRYDATQRALYLQELNIDTLSVDGDRSNVAAQLLPLFNVMLSEYVRRNPLYRFGPDELKLGPLLAEISDLQIVDGGIRLKLKPR
jgi:hypothetical protein